jgi:hypothetical protein
VFDVEHVHDGDYTADDTRDNNMFDAEDGHEGNFTGGDTFEDHDFGL